MKPALAISGGGSKGAFAVGAILHLRQQLGLQFDMLAGTSTGALIAPLVIADELKELERIYTSVHTKDILKKPSRAQDVLTKGYFFDTAPLEKLVNDTMTPDIATKVLGSSVPAFLTAVCMQTGKLTYFQSGQFAGAPEGTAELIKVNDRATLISAMIASANQPVFTPPIAIGPANPLREYVDGGVREYAPINVVIANGALEIYVILLSPPSSEREELRGQMKGMQNVAMRTISLLIDEVGDNDLRLTQIFSEATQYLEEIRQNARALGLSSADVTRLFAGSNPFVGRRPVHLHVIRPAKPLPSNGLDFDPVVMKQMMKLGREAAKQACG